MDLKQANIDRFNELASEYDEDPERVEMATAVAASMLAALALKGTEQALEFGCGTGLITLRLAPQLAHVTAMDSSPGMLAVLRQKCEHQAHANVTIREGSLPDQLPDGHFDLIFSALTLHHIKNTEALLRALSDHLEPGGRVALADLDREDGSFHSNPSGVAHHGFGRDVLKEALAKTGFESIGFSTAHTVRKENNVGKLQEYPIFLAVAAKAQSQPQS